MAAGAHEVESAAGRGDPQTSHAGPGGENKPHHAQATWARVDRSWDVLAPGAGRASSPTELRFGLMQRSHEPVRRPVSRKGLSA